MPSIGYYIAKKIIENVVSYAGKKPIGDIQQLTQNSLYDYLVYLYPKVKFKTLDDAPVCSYRLEPLAGKAAKTLLYIHGGGFVIGSTRMYRWFLSYLVKKANVNIVSIDYRLAPKNPYPAAVEDVFQVYKWLMESGVNASQLVIGGDSAGGNLTLCLLQKIRESHLPMPSSAVLLSPWLDLTQDALIDTKVAKKDKIIPLEYIELCKDLYAQGVERSQPLISPMFADLSGFPPLFIQTGTGDTLYPQAEALRDRALEQGIDCVYDVWDDMPHAWQVLMTPLVKESRGAIKNIVDYINEDIDNRFCLH